MRRKSYLLLIIACVLAEGALIQIVPLLESSHYPLVSSLTCIETDDVHDLYWNINQIEVTGGTRGAGPAVLLALRHNIPGFDSYVYRIDGEGSWHRTARHAISLNLTRGEHLLEVKAANVMGGMLPPVSYTLVRDGDRVRIAPDGKKIIRGNYEFRFECNPSPKVAWLQQHTLPVVAGSRGQWDAYLRLRKWVREQIPNRAPSLNAQWDAQRILQTVWTDAGAGFLCDAYAATYVSACVSAGLQARMLHLGDGRGRGHYATEIWSDDYQKWVFMDPLYDCYFTAGSVPLTALELHNRWKTGRVEGLKQRSDEREQAGFDQPRSDYLSLFQDVQLINANDFLSRPFTSVLDLLTGTIRSLRWVDESNPPYNRVQLACRLLLFYYLPKVMRLFVIPFCIPLCVVVLGIMLVKRT